MRNKDRIIIGALAALLMATLLSNIGLIMRDISHCSCPNAAVLQQRHWILQELSQNATLRRKTKTYGKKPKSFIAYEGKGKSEHK